MIVIHVKIPKNSKSYIYTNLEALTDHNFSLYVILGSYLILTQTNLTFFNELLMTMNMV